MLIAALILSLLCAAANGLLLFASPTRAELCLWRRLNIQALRRKLTPRDKIRQPLSPNSVQIARRNIVWHIALTLAMSVTIAHALTSQAPLFKYLAMLCVAPCIAWLSGSVVQRHKMALLLLASRKPPDNSCKPTAGVGSIH